VRGAPGNRRSYRKRRPLIFNEESNRYSVTFASVGHLVVLPELVGSPSDASETVAPYIFLEKDSHFFDDYRWSAPMFDLGRSSAREEDYKHYIVWGENYCLHVLAASSPCIHHHQIFGKASS